MIEDLIGQIKRQKEEGQALVNQNLSLNDQIVRLKAQIGLEPENSKSARLNRKDRLDTIEESPFTIETLEDEWKNKDDAQQLELKENEDDLKDAIKLDDTDFMRTPRSIR